jgi:acyl-CoA dehydrogenase
MTDEAAHEGLAGSMDAGWVEIAAIAAQHANEHDRDGTFPAEALARARSLGLLAAFVPSEFGGGGASLAELAAACSRVAASCSSTGMILAMHHTHVACLVRHARNGSLLAAIAKAQMLVAASTTEGKQGGDIGRSNCAAEPNGSGFRLHKAASVVSFGAQADAIMVTARRAPDAAATDQVLIFLRKGDYELTQLSGWSALGMRATCSGSFDLSGEAGTDAIIGEPYRTIHASTMEPVAHVLWGAVWYGIAARALETARAFLRQSARQAGATPSFGADSLARGLAALALIRANIVSAARTFDAAEAEPPASGLGAGLDTTLVKVNASNLAVSATFCALEACGLAGYKETGSFSIARQLRDICSAPIMINNNRLLASVEKIGLMREISPCLQ